MQPVTPRTTIGTGALRLGGSRPRGGSSSFSSQDTAFGQDFLHGDAGGLAAPRLHARLGAVLELLGALGGHGDEAELAVDFLGKDRDAS